MPTAQMLALLLVGPAASFAAGSAAGAARVPVRVALRPLRTAAAMAATLPDASVEIDRSSAEAEATVTVTIPGDATRVAFDTLVRKAKSQVQVSGFKKGKAPDALVIGEVGRERLASDAIATLLEHYAQAAVGNAPDLDAIGEPQVLDQSEALVAAYRPGEPLTVRMQVELWPRIDVSKGDYEGVAVTIDVPPFNQKAYDETLRQLQQRQSTLEDMDADHAAEEGDTVLVDMAGFEKAEGGGKGAPLDVASGSDLTVELARGKFMPGLVEGLLGAKPGETRLVDVAFSSRSQQRQLAGKDLLFEVTVKAVQQRVLPPLDDDFASSIQPGMSMEALNTKVREGVQAEVDKMVRERTFVALEEALVGLCAKDTPVPDTLVTEHARKKFATMLTDLKDRGEVDDEQIKAMVTPEAFDQYKQDTLDKTTHAVRASLVVDAIAKVEGVAVDRAEVEEQKQLMISSDPEGLEKVDDALLMSQIEATLLREKVLDLIASKAQVTKVEMADEESS